MQVQPYHNFRESTIAYDMGEQLSGTCFMKQYTSASAANFSQRRFPSTEKAPDRKTLLSGVNPPMRRTCTIVKLLGVFS